MLQLLRLLSLPLSLHRHDARRLVGKILLPAMQEAVTAGPAKAHSGTARLHVTVADHLLQCELAACDR